jgi:xylitol oxidase
VAYSGDANADKETAPMIKQQTASGSHDDADPRRNWAGNYAYRAARVQVPRTVADVQRTVASAARVKPLGTRHSFNDIADSPGDQISLERFDQMELDEPAGTVTVGAGVRYGTLATFLHERGYALHNLASLPHISVAGACATATHGSGCRNGNLATAVRSLELVTASGDLRTVSREHDADEFAGTVVSLGALGVVTKLTLAVERGYEVRQVVYQNLSFDQLKNHFDAIYGSGYSVSLFTDWQAHRASEVWVKQRLDDPATNARDGVARDHFGATAATTGLHPIAGISPVNCTEQLGVPGPWHERLPHFRMNFTPSSGEELQSEYFVPRERGYDAILAVERMKDRVTPHLLISELRTIAADDLWMSPCYRRPSLAIHFTWKPHAAAVRELMPLVEEQLRPFTARPHWGKLFTMPGSELRARYERVADFDALRRRFDPQGKFTNDFLRRTLSVA